MLLDIDFYILEKEDFLDVILSFEFRFFLSRARSRTLGKKGL